MIAILLSAGALVLLAEVAVAIRADRIPDLRPLPPAHLAAAYAAAPVLAGWPGWRHPTGEARLEKAAARRAAAAVHAEITAARAELFDTWVAGLSDGLRQPEPARPAMPRIATWWLPTIHPETVGAAA